MPGVQQLRDKFEQEYVLGVSQIDQIHHEFVDLLAETLNSAGDDFKRMFQRLWEHTQLHFFEEEARMAAFSFAGQDAHKADHDRILKKMEELSALVAAGDHATALDWLASDLPDWFDKHTRTMDGAAVARVLQCEAS